MEGLLDSDDDDAEGEKRDAGGAEIFDGRRSVAGVDDDEEGWAGVLAEGRLSAVGAGDDIDDDDDLTGEVKIGVTTGTSLLLLS